MPLSRINMHPAGCRPSFRHAYSSWYWWHSRLGKKAHFLQGEALPSCPRRKPPGENTGLDTVTGAYQTNKYIRLLKIANAEPQIWNYSPYHYLSAFLVPKLHTECVMVWRQRYTNAYKLRVMSVRVWHISVSKPNQSVDCKTNNLNMHTSASQSILNSDTV